MEEKQLGLKPKVFTETRPSLQETVERLSKMRSTLKDLVIEEPATSEMFRNNPPRQSLYRSLRRYYSVKEKNQKIDERMIEKIRQDLDEFINQDPYHVNILNFLPAELIFDLYSDPEQKEKFAGYLDQLINTANKKNFALFIKSIPSLIDKDIITNNNFPNDILQTPDPDVRRKVTEITPILVEKGIIPPSQYISFLQDPDPYVRGKVLETMPALIERGIVTKENLPNDVLDNILKDSNPYVRGIVARTAPLLIDQEILPPSRFYSFLQDPNPYVRGEAVKAIPELIERRIATKENFPNDVLDKILKDPDPYVRGSIAGITPLLVKEEIIPPSRYLSFLQDPNPDVRKKFATTIPSLITEGIIPPSQYFSLFLENPDPYVLEEVVKAIPELIKRGIVTKENLPNDVLDNILKDSNPYVRGIVARTAPLLIDQEILPPSRFYSFLQDPNPYVRGEAVKAIPELIERRIVTKENFPNDVLNKILQDADSDVRREAVKTMSALIERGIVTKENFPNDVLDKILKDPDSYVRGQVAEIAPLLIKKRIIPLSQYLSFLQDPDLHVREKAFKVIPMLIEEGKISLDQYLFLLEDPDPWVRGAIVETLPALIGKNITKENFPDFILQDSSPYVREKVADIIPLLFKEGIFTLTHYLALLYDRDPNVRKKASMYIPLLIEEGKISLDQYLSFLQDPDPYVRGAFVRALPILINRGIIQYPLNNPDLYLPQGIAQNFTPLVLAQAIKETSHKINLVLKEKKLDDKVLPGLLILGSAIKGYWLPNSDIDWGLIVDSTIDKDALKTTVEKITSSLDAQGISLCRCHVIYVDNLKNGDISEMDLSEKENDEIFTLLIGQWVGNTDIRNLRNSLIRKFLNKHPEEKTKILDRMVDNLVTEGLMNKGIKRRFGKEEVDDTYKKIASLLFVSKIGLPENS